MKNSIFSTAFIFLIMSTVTVFMIFFVNNYIKKTQEEEIITQAKQATLLTPPEDILSLSRNAEDLNRDSYKRLKNNLTLFRQFNPQIRFAYILGYDQALKKQFFYVDSEPKESKDYSPPGQIYEDASDFDIKKYLEGNDYIQGTYKDSWGEWVSSYSPIKDEYGNIVGLLGIDISNSVWKKQIIFSTALISIVGFLLTILLLSLVYLINRKQVFIDSLTQRTNILSNKEKKLIDMQQQAQIGQLTFYSPENFFYFDEQLSSIFGFSKDRKVALEDFLRLIHPNDTIPCLKFFESLKEENLEKRRSLEFSIGNHSEGFKKYKLQGEIKDVSTNKFLFVGFLQNIDG